MLMLMPLLRMLMLTVCCDGDGNANANADANANDLLFFVLILTSLVDHAKHGETNANDCIIKADVKRRISDIAPAISDHLKLHKKMQDLPND